MLTEAERNIRGKFRRSIKSKLETKLTDEMFFAEDIDIKELEDELLAEMEDTIHIQEEIKAFKQHIESWDYSDASININGDEQEELPYYVTGWPGDNMYEPDFKGAEKENKMALFMNSPLKGENIIKLKLQSSVLVIFAVCILILKDFLSII